MIPFSLMILFSFLFTCFVLQEELLAKEILNTCSNPSMGIINIKIDRGVGRNKQIVEKLGLNALKLKKQISNPYAEATELKIHAVKKKSTAARQVMLSSQERHLHQQHENEKRYQKNIQSLYHNQLQHHREQILQITSKK